MVSKRMAECGYVPFRNKAKDGLWKINGKRQVVYVKKDLPPNAQYQALKTLIDE
jgi:hypothetical protein